MSSRASRRCGGKNSLISHRTKKETPRLSAGGSLSVRQPVHIIPTGLLARVANPRFAVLILEPRTSPAVRAGPCDHTRCARFHVVPLSSCCLPYKYYSTLPCTLCQIDPRSSVRVKIGLSRNAKKIPPAFRRGALSGQARNAPPETRSRGSIPAFASRDASSASSAYSQPSA